MCPQRDFVRAVLLQYSKRAYVSDCCHADAPDGNAAAAQLTTTPRGSVSNTLVVPVHGEQRRLGDSSAFFNAQEAEVLVELLASLIEEQAALARAQAVTDPVSQQEVGVICLSRAQVVHVRNRLRAQRLGDVNVGTVDDFQGQERRVVFISTVLTSAVRRSAVHVPISVHRACLRSGLERVALHAWNGLLKARIGQLNRPDICSVPPLSRVPHTAAERARALSCSGLEVCTQH